MSRIVKCATSSVVREHLLYGGSALLTFLVFSRLLPLPGTPFLPRTTLFLSGLAVVCTIPLWFRPSAILTLLAAFLGSLYVLAMACAPPDIFPIGILNSSGVRWCRWWSSADLLSQTALVGSAMTILHVLHASARVHSVRRGLLIGCVMTGIFAAISSAFSLHSVLPWSAGDTAVPLPDEFYQMLFLLSLSWLPFLTLAVAHERCSAKTSPQ